MSIPLKKTHRLSRYDIDYDDMCNECDDGVIQHLCDKCGNGVCNRTKCQWSFPTKFESVTVICNGCFNDIDNKLINYDHLLIYKFLKKNMRTRRVSC